MSAAKKGAGTDLPATVTVAYPGAFRPVPSFEIDVPALWVVGEFPGALFMCGTQARDDGAYANVVVRHRRVARDTEPVDHAQSSWVELVASYPDIELVEERFLQSGATTEYIREALIPASDSSADGPLCRVDSIIQARPENSATDDVFQLTALMPEAHSAEFAPDVFKLLASFRFTAGSDS